MRLFRPYRYPAARYPTALLLLVSLVFGQLALAAYRCPADNVENIAQAIAGHNDLGTRMAAGCDGMDPEEPNLCQANAQVGNQSIDKPLPPCLQPFVAAGSAIVLHATNDAPEPVRARLDDTLLTRTGAPPIAICNCCFRI